MLENILTEYFGLAEDWNDDSEKAQEKWYNSYDKLVYLIYELQDLGVLDNADKITDALDEITNED